MAILDPRSSQVTIGGNQYWIYGSLSGADEYFAASQSSAVWGALTDEQKSIVLVSAARFIDRQQWQGQRTVTTQPLAFPRTGLLDCDGNAVADDTIPDGVVLGSYETALSLNNDPNMNTTTGTGQNIERVEAGSVEVEFFGPTAGTRFPVNIQELMGCFLSGVAGQSALTGPFVRGTDQTSVFQGSPFGFSTEASR